MGVADTASRCVTLRSPDGLTLPVEAFDEAIDERTAFVLVNRVLYRSSALLDAAAVCAIARERGALSFVDDYHGLGVVPLDLHALGCDVYAAGALKFMCGGPGCVFLYARADVLPRLYPDADGLVRDGRRRSTSRPGSPRTTPTPVGSSTGRRRRPVFPIALGRSRGDRGGRRAAHPGAAVGAAGPRDRRSPTSSGSPSAPRVIPPPAAAS